jgi:hypothetical protein
MDMICTNSLLPIYVVNSAISHSAMRIRKVQHQKGDRLVHSVDHLHSREFL